MSVDERSLADLVADAVVHLHDLPYLQTHALAELLAGQRGASHPAGLRGAALRQTLLEAIQTLKPASNAPGCAHGWRIYRYLFLRFVQAASPQEVARDLAISERQARRVYREAIDALASVLADRYRPSMAAGVPLEPLGSLALAGAPLAETPSDRLEPISGSILDQVDQEVQQLAVKGHGSSCDLAEVLQGLRSIIEPLVSQRGAFWAISLAPGLERIAVDRSIVRQILLGLLVAFLDCQPGRLALRAQPERERILITVRSTFDRESEVPRLREALDPRLAITRRLVEAEGGTLVVAELDGGAAQVEVRLPTIGRRRIIVIDDNAGVVTLFRRYLESAGFEVVAAESGDEGFRLAKEVKPQAITLDVMMASRDGWETLQLLKNDPETQDIPVLVCSVLREEGLARFLGATALLPKPVTRDDLLAALARCGLMAPAGEPQSSPQGSA